MAFAYLSGTTANDDDQDLTTITGPIDTTGAGLIVLFSMSGVLLPTPTDSESNTWTALTAYDAGGGVKCKAYYTLPSATDAAHTFTVAAGTYPTIGVMAFSVGGTAVFDTENGDSAVFYATDVHSPGSVTPSAHNSLIVAGIGFQQAHVISSIDSGFTIASQIAPDTNTNGGGVAYLIQGSATAVNPIWTHASSVNAGNSIAVFMEDAGGGAAVTHHLTLLGVGG
jgi:hypothetical protein